MDRPSGKRFITLDDNGRIAVLGDGSAWLIDPGDRAIAARWKPGARVKIAGAGQPESVLTNTDVSEDIRVAYAGQR
jgi:hypothetical protein